MFRRTLGALMPALLIFLVAMLPSVAATLPDDPAYHTTVPQPSGSTCHSTTACTPATDQIWAFHNDGSQQITVWARHTGTKFVDYWQCIDPGLYSGDTAHGPQQGSTHGGWTGAPTTVPYLGDFDRQGSPYQLEWYNGCWAPCHGTSSGCLFLTPFKIDQN